MTIFSVLGREPVLTVRYVPALAWAFGVLAAYGVGSVIAGMAGGRIPVQAGSLFALLGLIGFTAFVLVSGGQLVLARFDRAADMVQIRRYGLTGFVHEERRLSEIVGLELRLLRRAQHRIELRFRSGERLPLTSYYVISFNNRGLDRLSALLGIAPTRAEEPHTGYK
jgi:hypothetical protein